MSGQVIDIYHRYAPNARANPLAKDTPTSKDPISPRTARKRHGT